MQTFLPSPCFVDSAYCLDRLRLGKQRVEVLQILQTLIDGGGWAHHPAVRMWERSPLVLAAYGHAICAEWVERGYRDTISGKITQLVMKDAWRLAPLPGRPRWLGDPAFHESHRQALLVKNFEWYAPFFQATEKPTSYEYIWPGAE